FDVARRPVRYVAPAPHQDRRPRRRDEDDDPSALADLLPRAGYPALRSRTHTAPRHLTGGARAPQIFTIVPSTPNPPHPKLWLQAGADAVRPNAGEIQRNHPKTPPTTAEPPKRCIKRANTLTSFADLLVWSLNLLIDNSLPWGHGLRVEEAAHGALVIFLHDGPLGFVA